MDPARGGEDLGAGEDGPGGAFLAAPNREVVHRSFGGTSSVAGSGQATGTFDHLGLTGTSGTGGWTATDIGAPTPHAPPGSTRPGASTVTPDGVYTLTGQGDIAPDENNPDMVQMSFQGVFVGLLFMATLGTLFVTSEYKRGLIRTTFTATPSRLKVLAAKTTVIGAVTFVTGLPATAIGFTVAQRTLRSNGFQAPEFPRPLPPGEPGPAGGGGQRGTPVTGRGPGPRRGRGAAQQCGHDRDGGGPGAPPADPLGRPPLPAAQWLLRVTPAAAFAIQQGVTYYPQVHHNCLPEGGCYPLTPYHGLAVLAAYAVAALLLAAWTVRRRDA